MSSKVVPPNFTTSWLTKGGKSETAKWRTQAGIDALEEEHGSNLESETELARLKQLKEIYKTELEEKKKELAEVEKQAKNKEKLQAKVDREKKNLTEMERERSEIEERLNSTKRLDELDEDESRLKRLNEEDQVTIDDVYTSEFQPRSKDLFPSFRVGREKALASAGHVSILHPEILGVIN